MDNPKTTVTGVITGIISLLGLFHIGIPDWVTPLATAIGVTLIGIFAKDGGNNQTAK